MNMVIGSLTFVPLLMVALAHLVWSLGQTWPIRSEELLARTVVGTPGVMRMPNRFVMFLGGVGVFATGVIALSLADHESGGLLLTLVGLGCAAVYLARGLAAYTPGWRQRFPTEPFATLDRRNYGPLCLWVGTGFLILVLMRLL